MNKNIFRCKNCKQIVNNRNTECKCGSSEFELLINEDLNINIGEELNAEGNKVKYGKKKRKSLEFYSKKTESKKTDTGNAYSQRLINRETDFYSERILDEKGEVIHECHEKLSNHQGHGSAKFNK